MSCKTTALFVAALALGQTALAQQGSHCALTDTMETCKQKVEDALRPADFVDATEVDPSAAVESGAKARARLLAALPPEISALPGASSALEDFLGRLRIGVAETEIGEDGGTALAVELTNFLGMPTAAGYKVQGILRPAELLEGFRSQLSAEESAAAEKELGDFDDLLLTFSWVPPTERFLRRPEIAGTAAQLMLAQVRSKVLQDNAAILGPLQHQQLILLGRIETAQGTLFQNGDFTGRFEQVADSADGQRLLELTEQIERATWDRKLKLAAGLRKRDFFLLGDLVQNQPQLALSVSHTLRDDAVGPAETSVRLTYELGFVRYNQFAKACPVDDTDRAGCLERFLTPERRRYLEKERSDRFTLSLEWTRTADHSHQIGNAMVDLDEVRRWTGSLAWGRVLRFDESHGVISRVDLTGSYEDWSDDAMHQNRGIVKLSFTQRLSDELSAVVGAVWATKPELRGEVARELSARAGLTWSLKQKE